MSDWNDPISGLLAHGTEDAQYRRRNKLQVDWHNPTCPKPHINQSSHWGLRRGYSWAWNVRSAVSHTVIKTYQRRVKFTIKCDFWVQLTALSNGARLLPAAHGFVTSSGHGLPHSQKLIQFGFWSINGYGTSSRAWFSSSIKNLCDSRKSIYTKKKLACCMREQIQVYRVTKNKLHAYQVQMKACS